MNEVGNDPDSASQMGGRIGQDAYFPEFTGQKPAALIRGIRTDHNKKKGNVITLLLRKPKLLNFPLMKVREQLKLCLTVCFNKSLKQKLMCCE